ncbi:MAG: hypothetical protein JWQ92_1530 [Amnibacterium sp.]|nr:hypothetical protein [Amnibacterium sp.]
MEGMRRRVAGSRVGFRAVIARNPYVQNVRDLVRNPGEMRERHLDFPAPEHLGEGLVAVAGGTPMGIDVKLESLHEGVLASGTVRTRADGECARCLAPVSLPVEVEFAELFAYPSEEPFDHSLQGDTLDLEPVVRDAVVLALPFQPECVDGCEDLDLGPGINLITVDAPKPVDARWAALKDFPAAASDREER